MAIMLTTLSGAENQCQEFLYHFFWSKLSQQFYVWHNVVPPRSNQQIDFIILHPNYGMWIAEVKDWSLNQIIGANRNDCLVNFHGFDKTYPNPLHQSYENYLTVKKLLDNQDILRHSEGSLKGQLYFAIHHIVVFTNISREDLNNCNFQEFFPLNHTLTSDVVRNTSSDISTVEEVILKKRDAAFINEHGLRRQQIEAIKNTFDPSVSIKKSKKPKPEAIAETDDFEPQSSIIIIEESEEEESVTEEVNPPQSEVQSQTFEEEEPQTMEIQPQQPQVIVELNKLLEYIICQNKIILEKMWDKG